MSQHIFLSTKKDEEQNLHYFVTKRHRVREVLNDVQKLNPPVDNFKGLGFDSYTDVKLVDMLHVVGRPEFRNAFECAPAGSS